MTRFCFLDMDGVLADFVTGACQAHGRSTPYLDPKSFGVFNLESLWGISEEEFWVPTHKDGFWLDLPKMPEADAVVDLVCGRFGVDNIAILSAPSQDWRCIPEKQAWVKQYYPQLRKNMLFGSAKRFLAGSNRILIDDRDKNVDNFRDHGGIGIVMPQVWNSLYYIEPSYRVSYVREAITTFPAYVKAKTE